MHQSKAITPAVREQARVRAARRAIERWKTDLRNREAETRRARDEDGEDKDEPGADKGKGKAPE
jgi:hypothetical protein